MSPEHFHSIEELELVACASSRTVLFFKGELDGFVQLANFIN